MRPVLVITAACAGLFAASFGMTGSGSGLQALAAPGRCLSMRLPPAARAGETVQWGHIRSLARKGRRFELRFDPAWWLTGLTAQRAAVQDGSIRPGEAVPNDYYVVDESHRILTYRVPANARVTVIGREPACLIAIGVAELAEIVHGRNPKHRRLFDRARALGYWIEIRGDAIRSLDQQYQP